MAAVQVGEARRVDFGELVRAHQSMVFSLVYHFLHDRELAEEVAQEVFLSLHQNLGRIQIGRACGVLAAEGGGAARD